MDSVHQALVLRIFVVCTLVRSTRPDPPDVPPDQQHEHFIYPIALAEEIVANLPAEGLRMFNKVFSEDACNRRRRCPCRNDQVTLFHAVGVDNVTYYVVQTETYKQRFKQEICTSKSSLRCQPSSASRRTACHQEGDLVYALVDPNPATHFTTKHGVFHLNGSLYTRPEWVVKEVFVPCSKCRCHDPDKHKLIGGEATYFLECTPSAKVALAISVPSCRSGDYA